MDFEKKSQEKGQTCEKTFKCVFLKQFFIEKITDNKNISSPIQKINNSWTFLWLEFPSESSSFEGSAVLQ